MPRLPRTLRLILLGGVTLAVLAVVTLAILAGVVSSRLPDVQTLRSTELQEPMYVYANDGRLMGLFGEMRRYPVEIEAVPLQVKQAFLAAEDANFYEHNGIDATGVARAIWLLAKTGGQERVAGGSTITQQVAKQFFLSSEYSFRRKFSEMLLAMKMERELSKDEILELYLNKSFFGNRAYGVAAAAEFYYGKTLDALTLDETATLAGIPKFPSSGNPISNPERARARRDNYILPRMAELGYVSRAEADAARALPMHASPHERQVEVHAPYVAEMVRQEMIARYGDDVLTKGYHVTTTIDPALQAAAERAVVDGMRVYDHRHGWRKPEQKVQIPDGADARAVARLLRNTPAQGGLLPAVVTASGNGGLQVVLADGSELTLGSAATSWTGKTGSALAQRGDVVRVRRSNTDKPDAAPRLGDRPTAARRRPRWSRWTRTTARCARWSAASAMPATSSTAPPRRVASRVPASSRSSTRRRSNAASTRPRSCWTRRWCSRTAAATCGARRTTAATSPARCACAKRWCSRATWSRCACSTRSASTTRAATSAISASTKSRLPPNLSMSLGTASLTPLSVARGYAAFANGGFLVTPWFIDSVRDRDGRDIFKEKPATACPYCAVVRAPGQATTTVAQTKVDGFDFGPAGGATAEAATASDGTEPAVTTSRPRQPTKPVDPTMVVAPRAIDPRVAWQLQSMMRDVVKRGTATDARVLGREDVGGKTGSTNDHRDAWFSGFGGQYVTTVWVGRDDFKPLGYREYGGRAALPIWIGYMKVALEGQPERDLEPPAGMAQVKANGVVEWLKVEDQERMQSELDSIPEQDSQPGEDAFDIF